MCRQLRACASLPGRVLVVLLLVVRTWCATCPTACDCPSPTAAVCYSAPAAATLPVGLPAGLRTLQLNDHDLSYLANNSLAGLPALLQLQLRDDRIHTVQPAAFRPLTQLQTLGLQDNFVEHLHPDTFVDNHELWFLDLSGNYLHVGNNSVFLNSQSLRELNMSRCRLDYLPDLAFQSLPDLRVLHLEDNFLHFLHMHMLSPMHLITHLYLQNNKINSLRNLPPAPAVLQFLTYVDLSGNFLHTLDVDALRVLTASRQLVLEANPLVCDCGLAEARAWLEARGIQAPGQCAAPYQVAGADWRTVHLPPCGYGPASSAPGGWLPASQSQASGVPRLSCSMVTLAAFVASVFLWTAAGPTH